MQRYLCAHRAWRRWRGLAGAVLLVVAAARSVAAAGPPNLLLITLDTTRADHLGAYGRPAADTPAIDALAARGVLFEQAYTSAPTTLPAHATILTGLDPPEHGLHVNGAAALGREVPTLAEVLRGRGYHTGAFVAAFVLNRKFGLDRGFEVYDDDLQGAKPQELPEPLSVYRPGNLVADAALAWLERQATAEPFFCWVHLYDPHYPHYAHPELAGTRFADQASYEAEVAFMDRQVGRLTAFLAARGLADRTVVVVVGDHGEGLGDHGEAEHGYLLYEEILRVPLLVSAPGRDRPGLRVAPIVSAIDLVPTIRDLLGVPPDPALRGRTLVPTLTGGQVAPAPSYAETDLPLTVFGWSPLRSLTTTEWRYIRTTRPELYDRRADPGERSNLAEERRAEVTRLDAELTALERRMRAHDAGPVALSAGERQRLEALGYVAGSETPVAGGAPRRDIKDMLPVKRLEVRLARGVVGKTLTQEQAIALARELVQRSPETPPFHKQLGSLLLTAGRVEDARVSLDEAVRLRPEYAEAHALLGDAARRQERLGEAIGHWSEAVRLKPDLTETALSLATGLATQGRLEEAVARYEQVLREDPGSADAHYNLANTQARLGRRTEAVDHYQAALRLRPDMALAHHNLGRVLEEEGKPKDAAERYRQAIRLTPDFAPAQFALGRLLAAEGQLPEARAALEAAVRLAPNEPQSAAALAWLLATAPDEKLRDADRAVTLAEGSTGTTRDARTLDALGAAYANAGRFDDAKRAAWDAAESARTAKDPELVLAIEERLVLYMQGRPYRQARARPVRKP